ncbi:hypothetical protein [Novosphingobium huizhouense]|nr:hypothetical protein [Novosphingobium huizhouense]
MTGEGVNRREALGLVATGALATAAPPGTRAPQWYASRAEMP